MTRLRERTVPARESVILFFLALCALIVGTFVYVLDRPPDSTPVFAAFDNLKLAEPLFGVFGGNLPSFVHVFAFSVLTFLMLGQTRSSAVKACGGWLLIDSLFELGQHKLVYAAASGPLPERLFDLPGFDFVRTYFERGTFDVFDLVSVATGAFLAYALLWWRCISGSES